MLKQKKLITRLVLILTALTFFTCSTNQARISLRNKISGTPAKNYTSYAFNPETPLEERVKAAPDFLLSYLKEIDNNSTYSIYMPAKHEITIIRKYLALLPQIHQNILKDRLIGIYFINNFTGSGMVEYVLEGQDRIFGVLIINPETLRNNISDWMTYRENTCFTADTQANDIKITIDCGKNYSGLIYILLHETTHLVDYVEHYTPYVEEDMRELGFSLPETDFTKEVWINYDEPAKDFDFSLRRDISFYGLGHGPSIPAQKAAGVYNAFSRTPFVSLYGAQNWAEDFVEYFTWYYFTVKLKQPYKSRVAAAGKILLEYEPMKSEKVLKRAGSILKLMQH
ncbi:MAG: hypothetical protein V1874_06170 [Spirochaetota bacterium]